MSELKQFYVGIKGVVYNPKLKKVLLLKKYNQQGKLFWDIPGGRINDTDDIGSTLRRELVEELSTKNDFSIHQILHAYRLSRDLKDGMGLVLIFYKVISDIEYPTLSSEHNGYDWFSKEELYELSSGKVYIEKGYYEAVEKLFETV